MPAAPQVVSFSFDVGNGPVELTVHADAPLNDDQWHRVMAERNVKEAVLHLDQTYRASRLAPAQGHTRLELFSQLYVGKKPQLRFAPRLPFHLRTFNFCHTREGHARRNYRLSTHPPSVLLKDRETKKRQLCCCPESKCEDVRLSHERLCRKPLVSSF